MGKEEEGDLENGMTCDGIVRMRMWLDSRGLTRAGVGGRGGKRAYTYACGTQHLFKTHTGRKGGSWGRGGFSLDRRILGLWEG